MPTTEEQAQVRANVRRIVERHIASRTIPIEGELTGVQPQERDAIRRICADARKSYGRTPGLKIRAQASAAVDDLSLTPTIGATFPRKHPVKELISHHVYHGSLPKPYELEDLKISKEQADAIAAVCAEGQAVRKTGDQALAHSRALEAADAVIAQLPAEQHEADYLTAGQRPPEDGMNPDELAAFVLSRQPGYR